MFQLCFDLKADNVIYTLIKDNIINMIYNYCIRYHDVTIIL